jgi:hypothetical protein
LTEALQLCYPSIRSGLRQNMSILEIEKQSREIILENPDIAKDDCRGIDAVFEVFENALVFIDIAPGIMGSLSSFVQEDVFEDLCMLKKEPPMWVEFDSFFRDVRNCGIVGIKNYSTLFSTPSTKHSSLSWTEFTPADMAIVKYLPRFARRHRMRSPGIDFDTMETMIRCAVSANGMLAILALAFVGS